MATNWTGFNSELLARIEATWPETSQAHNPPGGGIYAVSESARQSVFRVQNYPLSVLQYRTPRSGDWGLVNSAFETPVRFYYVDRYPVPNEFQLPQQTVQNKVDQFRHDLIAQGGQLTTATVLDCEEMDWSDDDPVLAMLIGKNEQLICAFVTFMFVIGEMV